MVQLQQVCFQVAIPGHRWVVLRLIRWFYLLMFVHLQFSSSRMNPVLAEAPNQFPPLSNHPPFFWLNEVQTIPHQPVGAGPPARCFLETKLGLGIRLTELIRFGISVFSEIRLMKNRNRNCIWETINRAFGFRFIRFGISVLPKKPNSI
jgi:hypothetical protein